MSGLIFIDIWLDIDAISIQEIVVVKILRAYGG